MGRIWSEGFESIDPDKLRSEGWATCDWSQVELRILAKLLADGDLDTMTLHYLMDSGWPRLPKLTSIVLELALLGLQEPPGRPRDVHEAIAMQMFGRPRSGLTEAEETLRRAVSFGMLYGRDSMKARRQFAMSEGYRRAYGKDA